MEEVTESPGTQEEKKLASAGNLLQQNTSETFINDATMNTTQDVEPINQLICNRLEINSHASPLNLEKKEQIRWLKKLVPGLDGDLSYLDSRIQNKGVSVEPIMDIY